MNKNYYEYAVQLHNQEFRTIGERANSALIVQSILISGIILILINEKNIFGYIYPYVVTGIILIGALISFFLHMSGQEGAKSAFLWRRYMRRLEAGERSKPWNWFYKHHNDSREVRREGDSGLISKFPLPYSWIIIPLILLGIWSIASLYIPIRINFDSSFPTESCITVVVCISRGSSIIIWSLFIFVLYRIWLWFKKW